MEWINIHSAFVCLGILSISIPEITIIHGKSIAYYDSPTGHVLSFPENINRYYATLPCDLTWVVKKTKWSDYVINDCYRSSYFPVYRQTSNIRRTLVGNKLVETQM